MLFIFSLVEYELAGDKTHCRQHTDTSATYHDFFAFFLAAYHPPRSPETKRASQHPATGNAANTHPGTSKIPPTIAAATLSLPYSSQDVPSVIPACVLPLLPYRAGSTLAPAMPSQSGSFLERTRRQIHAPLIDIPCSPCTNQQSHSLPPFSATHLYHTPSYLRVLHDAGQERLRTPSTAPHLARTVPKQSPDVPRLVAADLSPALSCISRQLRQIHRNLDCAESGRCNPRLGLVSVALAVS